MTTQAMLFAAAGASAGLAAWASISERRRAKRQYLDNVGWVPWPLVQVLSVLGTVLLIVLAVKS